MSRIGRLLAPALVAMGALAATTVVQAHGGGHAKLSGPITDGEREAYAAAKPVFERHCFRCHTSTGEKAKPKSLAHLNMDRYPLGGHHAREVGSTVRQVLGAGPAKKKATMPSDDPGAVSGEELAKVIAWANAFDHAHPAPKATHAAHH